MAHYLFTIDKPAFQELLLFSNQLFWLIDAIPITFRQRVEAVKTVAAPSLLVVEFPNQKLPKTTKKCMLNNINFLVVFTETLYLVTTCAMCDNERPILTILECYIAQV